ncbi:hypothetical protein MHC_01930 [Mycoplasma haemocanis str. Illinois]|uniref:Uncharacterized protein n=1 Tax=Mycoplasma haemocanis (strain Illinois) TaxID=1111676 RepID=H6N6I0_MYCHN|nr:hypothetical protein [Mycoplasma haemocanis]AEW45252.1 hypothetical protein MHC_01930 [Mycoplasma haemocanis str. Illinois]
MNVLKIGLASTASLGGVVGGGFLIKNAISSKEKQTLSTRLTSEGFELLNDSHSSQWSTSLSKYNSKKASGVEGISEDKLKSICKELLSKDKRSEEDYNKAKRYCVVPQNISTRLSKLGFTALNTTESTHQQQWTTLATAYVTKGTGNNQIESLSLQAENSNKDNWSKLRDKCKVVVEKDHWTEDFDAYLEKAKMWCTLESISLFKN